MQITTVSQIESRKDFEQFCKENSNVIITGLEFLMKEIKEKFLDRNTDDRETAKLKKEYNHLEDLVFDFHNSSVDINKSIFTSDSK